MANTYTLIQAKTLDSATSSVTFTTIPQTYTDLLIRVSARVNTSGGYTNVMLGLNGSTSNITWLGLYAYGGSNTGSNTNTVSRVVGSANANSSTSNTFSNNDLYIPNYTSPTFAKSFSSDSVVESNDNTNPLLELDALLWNPETQAAITSITLTSSAVPTADFVINSTFYLYGISKT
jgi:hypothetical protein